MRTRRHRSDSISEAVRIMKDARRSLSPPPNVPLSQVDREFFANIIQEFPLSDWSPHQIEIAALLARAMNDLSVEQMALREEGGVIQGEKVPVPNPRKHIVQMHATNVVSLRRSLALHAAAAGKYEDIGKRAAIAKQVEADGALDSELLARH